MTAASGPFGIWGVAVLRTKPYDLFHLKHTQALKTYYTPGAACTLDF